jgi:D-threo-aldose 1-dehydrogenase
LLAVSERELATYDYKPVDDDRWERAQAIRRVCDAHGVDTRAAALQYPLRHPAVASVIPGAKTAAEVTANLGFVATEIPDALWADLDAEGLAQAI